MAEEKRKLLREDFNNPKPPRRRAIRNHLFKIRNAVRKGRKIDNDLKIFIENQFQFGMTWENFTFVWDVSPKDPLKVITEDQWNSEGGSFDPITGMNQPPSFTYQK